MHSWHTVTRQIRSTIYIAIRFIVKRAIEEDSECGVISVADYIANIQNDGVFTVNSHTPPMCMAFLKDHSMRLSENSRYYTHSIICPNCRHEKIQDAL